MFKKILSLFFGLIILAWVSFSAILYYGQDKHLFYPTPVNVENMADFKEYDVSFEREGVTLYGWLIGPERVSENNPLLVYYGGNGEDVSKHLPKRQRLTQTTSFLYIEYRGYGRSEGHPGQQALVADARFILEEVSRKYGIPMDHVVLMGRSLGTSIAIHTAHEHSVRGLVLITPFDSIQAIASEKYPYLPISLLLKHPFNSVSLAHEIDRPVLMLMAENDGLVSRPHSENLADNWGGELHRVIVPSVGHNTIVTEPGTWDAINQFMAMLAQQ